MQYCLMLMATEFDRFHYWMEISSFFFGGIVVAIIGAVGLYQLVLSKQALQITSQREAFRLASEKCDHYLNHIIPLLNKLNQVIEAKDIKLLKDSKVTIDGNEIRVEVPNSKDDLQKMIEITPQFSAALNALEGFAVYFTSRLADERIAFETVGQTYVNSTGRLAPFFLNVNEDGFYKNLTKLFILWTTRLEKQRLEIEKSVLEAKAKKISVPTIKSLGT